MKKQRKLRHIMTVSMPLDLLALLDKARAKKDKSRSAFVKDMLAKSFARTKP
jgi:metal-responsive CopG/Arc/MetJ family transcriptional regulator